MNGPLNTLIELAQKTCDRAGRNLAQEHQRSQQASDQLAALRQYRREYAERMQVALQDGTDAATLANFRAFLQSLDKAIERAQSGAEQQEKRVEGSRQQWRQERQRLSSFDTLATRQQQREQQQSRRRELLQNDEFTSNHSARLRLQAEQAEW
ncbi:flagellar export protein FliJ [Parahaliea mediterranea]|uniref:flagellar export protein FliJ n=1 Tax=Parahaliea mediterranea TaxID=651086 RepID=UPI000E2F80AE|nr:flagellar export protein FliJ [Parahaliea mediterranea]